MICFNEAQDNNIIINRKNLSSRIKNIYLMHFTFLMPFDECASVKSISTNLLNCFFLGLVKLEPERIPVNCKIYF